MPRGTGVVGWHCLRLGGLSFGAQALFRATQERCVSVAGPMSEGVLAGIVCVDGHRLRVGCLSGHRLYVDALGGRPCVRDAVRRVELVVSV